MKTIVLSLLVAGVALLAEPVRADETDNEIQEFKVDRSIDLPTASKAAHQAWKDQRFGMFIHWGPISQLGQQLGHSRNSPSHRTGGKPYKVAQLEPEVYDVQYKTFDPVKFEPDEMIKMAKAAGVDYIVFTTKHHGGFSMFDSAGTDYDMMSTPYKKDITTLFADASRANGMDFGFYYSPRDWKHPDCDSDKNHPRYIQFFKSQMEELLGNYGPIHEIWFDGLGPGNWGNTAAEVMGTIRKLHPDAMVNDRGGAGADFYTPEHNISYFNRDQSWEACHTTTGQWGYNPNVGPKKIEQLMEILLYVWGGDGNMLLNIGPMGDGQVNPLERKSFEQLAEWWGVHGEESIRGSRGGPYIPGPWGAATCKDNRAFLHVFRWPEQGDLTFPRLEGLQLQSARVLSGGQVTAEQNSDGYTVNVPKAERGSILTTVELTFDQPVYPVKPLQRVPSLTKKATLTSSDNKSKVSHLADQNVHTLWEGKLNQGAKEIWIEAAFAQPQTIASFSVGRGEEWVPKSKVAIEIPDGEGGWKEITSKGLKLRFETIKFLKEPVTTDRIRLNIKQAKKFLIAEFELFPPVR